MKWFCQSIKNIEAITTIACHLSCETAKLMPSDWATTAVFLCFVMELSWWQTHINCIIACLHSILTKICIMAAPRGAPDYLRVAGEYNLLHVIISLTSKLTVLSLARDYVLKNTSSLPFWILFLSRPPFFLCDRCLRLLREMHFCPCVSLDLKCTTWRFFYASGMSFHHPKCPILWYCNNFSRAWNLCIFLCRWIITSYSPIWGLKYNIFIFAVGDSAFYNMDVFYFLCLYFVGKT